MNLTPITQTRTIEGVSPPDVFNAYTGGIGSWWPPVYTPNAATLSGVTIEPAVGGRVYTTHTDMGDYVWGTVTAWDPPHGFVQSFWLAHPSDAPSEVEVTFREVDGGTDLHVEHRGWDEDNAGYRSKYGDWPVILDAFVQFALSPRD